MDTQVQTQPQDVTTSLWRYGMSLWRALDRERLEFFDPFRIAAQIGFRAARRTTEAERGGVRSAVKAAQGAARQPT